MFVGVARQSVSRVCYPYFIERNEEGALLRLIWHFEVKGERI